ncbi:MAG: N-acetyltransferase family protein [Bacillota bacterium]
MHIRDLTVEDIPALLEMAKAEPAFQVDGGEGFWTRKQLECWIRSEDDVLLAMEMDGKLIGFTLTAHHRPTGKVTLENHFIRADYRGRGVGTHLLAKTLVRLMTAGGTYLHLEVKANNDTALRFYERFGCRRGENMLWFGKQL